MVSSSLREELRSSARREGIVDVRNEEERRRSKRRVTAEEEGQWPLRKGIRDDQTCGAGGNTGENDDRSG